MDKLVKFLRKLNSEELSLIEKVLVEIKRNNVAQYDVKKLTGHNDIYRLRIQRFRIIFKKDKDSIDILDIARRNESTYKDY